MRQQKHVRTSDDAPVPCGYVDIELDPDAGFAYGALGRGGVAIVDISDPTVPVFVDDLDTPGLALGIVRVVR